LVRAYGTQNILNNRSTPLISLYFHIPFCTKKCSYCHFFVLPDSDYLKKRLLQGFHLELDQWSTQFSNLQIASIYFGGGTPSLMGPEAIHKILAWIKNVTILSPDVEITLEANPENISLELMKSYAQVGINRVSIGIQSLDDDLLQKIGRTHSANKAIEAVYATAQAKINNITVDLMYDLPCQNLATWNHTLNQIVQLPITHLSLYNLTIEPQTAFFKRKKEIQDLLPEEEVSLQMYELAVKTFEINLLKQYEISAFARNHQFSVHNVGYWTARAFIGFGPSAFSYWEGKRFKNVANLNQYCTKLEEGLSPIDFTEKLDPIAARCELLAINLRLLAGVNLSTFELLHGALDPKTQTTLYELEKEGFIKKDNTIIQLTHQGVLFYDTVAAEII
jgi:oxygen-independent coproporphyrinogen III oxidase